jgi:hypothetical protein
MSLYRYHICLAGFCSYRTVVSDHQVMYEYAFDVLRSVRRLVSFVVGTRCRLLDAVVASTGAEGSL